LHCASYCLFNDGFLVFSFRFADVGDRQSPSVSERPLALSLAERRAHDTLFDFVHNFTPFHRTS